MEQKVHFLHVKGANIHTSLWGKGRAETLMSMFSHSEPKINSSSSTLNEGLKTWFLGVQMGAPVSKSGHSWFVGKTLFQNKYDSL